MASLAHSQEKPRHKGQHVQGRQIAQWGRYWRYYIVGVNSQFRLTKTTDHNPTKHRRRHRSRHHRRRAQEQCVEPDPPPRGIQLNKMATSETNNEITKAWHWHSAKFPKTIARADFGSSKVFMLAAVDRREANVISKLPFSPAGAAPKWITRGWRQKPPNVAPCRIRDPLLIGFWNIFKIRLKFNFFLNSQKFKKSRIFKKLKTKFLIPYQHQQR